MSATSANPLLLGWIKDLYDVARERNSKGATTYKKAYESMKACPLTFNHPSEAQQLDGIGPKICDILAGKLKTHCEANGLPMPTRKRKRRAGDELMEGTLEEDTSTAVKKPRKKKAYVPALRSGAYALMLALSSKPEDSMRSFSKAELVILAQPHCDSSFEVSSEGNKFYSAWSSMRTLTDKDLVQEKGRPSRKYYLSDEGWEVARKIRVVQAEHDGKDVSKDVPSTIKDKFTKQPPHNKLPSKSLATEYLQLEVDSEGEKALPKSQRESRSASLENLQSGNERPHLGVRQPEREAESNIVDLLSDSESEPPTDLPSMSSRTEPKHQPAPKPLSAEPPHFLPPASQSSHVNRSTDSAAVYPSGATSSLPNSFSSLDFIPLPPGTFTVQLILDTREVRSRTDRDYIHDELVKKGVKPILRALELGDFFWVAKVNDPTTLLRHGEADEHSDELVLDCIVERKRLDDLVGSITDGRFSEQKFRLKKTGVKNVIYLIEEFSLSTEKETRFHEAIQTAIASTQVVNGYFVKKTQKIDDTIRYIARLTRMLQSLYESKPLYLIPTSIIEADNYLPLLQHLRTDPIHASRNYSLTYSTFASLSSKTDNLTLRDVFMKMLLCTKGVSADKALAVQKIWNTPRALIEALEACGTERERDFLLAEKMDAVVGRAKIKGALSQKVARIWGEE